MEKWLKFNRVTRHAKGDGSVCVRVCVFRLNKSSKVERYVCVFGGKCKSGKKLNLVFCGVKDVFDI